MTPWRISHFPVEPLARPRVNYLCKPYIFRLFRAHHIGSPGVMMSHRNIMFSAMQGFIVGELNEAVAPVSSSLNPI